MPIASSRRVSVDVRWRGDRVDHEWHTEPARPKLTPEEEAREVRVQHTRVWRRC
jgi:hypothetical protein